MRIELKHKLVHGLETWIVYVAGVQHSSFLCEQFARRRFDEILRDYGRAESESLPDVTSVSSVSKPIG